MARRGVLEQRVQDEPVVDLLDDFDLRDLAVPDVLDLRRGDRLLDRAVGVEKAITGSTLDADTIAAAAEASVAGAEPLSENGYKIELFKGLVAEQLEAIRG